MHCVNVIVIIDNTLVAAAITHLSWVAAIPVQSPGDNSRSAVCCNEFGPVALLAASVFRCLNSQLVRGLRYVSCDELESPDAPGIKGGECNHEVQLMYRKCAMCNKTMPGTSMAPLRPVSGPYNRCESPLCCWVQTTAQTAQFADCTQTAGLWCRMVFRDDLPSHSTHCAFQVGIYSFGPEDLTAQWARYCVQFVVVRTLVPHWGDIQHYPANKNFTAFSIFLGKGAGNFVPTDSVLPVAVLTIRSPWQLLCCTATDLSASNK